MNRQEQLDVATLLARLLQIDRENDEAEHWLWDRIRDCDIPRLRAYIDDPYLRGVFDATVKFSQ